MPRFFSSSKPRRISVTVRPNFERKPPDDCQRPEPRAASLTRMPMFGRTPTFSAYSRTSSSSVYFLDDRDDLAAHLLRQHRHLDEFEVLEAVADDRRVVGRHRRHREQLRLAAGLEAEAVLRAEVQHFLDDLALLVHLDRIDAAVLALILVLGDRALERAVDLAEPVLEDVGEAEQDRHGQAAQLQAIDQPLEIDAAVRFLGGMDLQVALLVDREVALSPARHVVQLGGFGGRPGRGAGSCSDRSGVRLQCAHLLVNRINERSFISFRYLIARKNVACNDVEPCARDQGLLLPQRPTRSAPNDRCLRPRLRLERRLRLRRARLCARRARRRRRCRAEGRSGRLGSPRSTATAAG